MVVYCDYDVVVWYNVNVIVIDKFSNVFCLWVSSVNNEFVVDVDLFVVFKVVGDYGGDLVFFVNDFGDGSVGYDFGVVFDGGVGGVLYYLLVID